ncbi:hypothetical protein CAE01nite_17900 [Cellulomonas aerilata]|uniref:Sensor-like histidine kinase SenX3 n=1 Tax=Cellulomonas aerilata TaxID=515326 RepID=A0A512DC83_9CELL|nr:hypothetical protein CAE01nite_17900 [Cellulomonas aerilata]
MGEAQRVAALRGYGLLDVPVRDDELEGVVRLAAAVAGVPTATLNLIDDHRQCQLTTVGFRGSDSPRTDSMCDVRFLEGRTVWTRDASTHPDYATNPWVTGQLAAVRFYASVPLVDASGHVLGTLCVFDVVPRVVTHAQLRLLEDAAGVVMALFERRRQARDNANLAAEADEQRTLVELTMGALEERYELTEAILETIDVGVAVAGPDGRLTMLNRAARDWLGVDADTRLDRGDHLDRYTVLAADGVTRLTPEQRPLRRALVEGSVSGEERVIAVDGRPPVRLTTSGRALLAADGTRLGAVIAMSDVTRDREQRAALESAHLELADRTRELERSNDELEQFAATVSHDLRSPLTVVDGYLELLDEVYDDALGDQGRSWVATARRGLGRTLALTDALLTYAQAGATRCVRRPVDLREVLDAAVVDLRHEVVGAGALIEGGELPTLLGDESLLRQLLQNLLGNAIKHRRPDVPCRVQVTAAPTDDGWVVSVADNGRGIPADQRQRVFAMFTTLDPGARTGHGVGLATCQRIVERHGGRIWVADTPGGGATVHVGLPQSTELSSPGSPGASAHRAG